MNHMFSPIFGKALEMVINLHGEQLRKGTNTPYISHLFATCALVLENGGRENQAIAALLHDAAEDQGGKETLDNIEKQFGLEVYQIVLDCSDTLDTPKPPWKERKENYLNKLELIPASSRLVSFADKVHNVRSILFDYRLSGDLLWDRFKADKMSILWYYNALHAKFKKIDEPAHRRLLDELTFTLKELNRLTEYNV